MSSVPNGQPAAAQTPQEAMVRTLRHEVGDLLQTVYAAVAILKERLPADMQLERRILGDMRSRAESCKELLDTVHDLVVPLELVPGDVSMADVVESAVRQVEGRFPEIQVEVTTPPLHGIRGDGRKLSQAVLALLDNALRSAEGRVGVEVAAGPAPGWVAVRVRDDGPGIPPEKADQIFSEFTTIPHGHLGPGLAMVRKVAKLHGGRVSGGNRVGGGFATELLLPPSPPG